MSASFRANYRGAKVRNAAELYGKINRVLGTSLFRSHQKRASGDRDWFRFLGSLTECRAAYDKHTGTAHDWDNAASIGGGGGQAPAGLSLRARRRALRRQRRRGRVMATRRQSRRAALVKAAKLSCPSCSLEFGQDSGMPLFF